MRIQQRYESLLEEIVLGVFGYNEDHGTLKELMADYEELILTKALLHFRGDMDATARALGINKVTLYRKSHQYGIKFDGKK